MTDDFTGLINNASCYSVNNSTSIYAYRNNVRYSYTQIGGRWYETAQQTYTNIPSSTTCYTYSDITALNTFSYMQPIFYFIAFLLGILVWTMCFWMWSKLIHWRGVRL